MVVFFALQYLWQIVTALSRPFSPFNDEVDDEILTEPFTLYTSPFAFLVSFPLLLPTKPSKNIMPGLLSNLARMWAPVAALNSGGENTTVTSPPGTPGTTSGELAAPPVYTIFDDASWAITHPVVSNVLGDHILPLYNTYIEDCSKATSSAGRPHDCADEEIHRLDMNTYQPASVYNYTKVGYQKIKAPPELFKLIRDFYDKNRGKDVTEWKTINTYHNMWDTPPTIMTLNQPTWEGGGQELQDQIWETAKDLMQEWSGQELSPVSLYGIRLYHNGSILAPQ